MNLLQILGIIFGISSILSFIIFNIAVYQKLYKKPKKNVYLGTIGVMSSIIAIISCILILIKG